jgi:hypothetical protein
MLRLAPFARKRSGGCRSQSDLTTAAALVPGAGKAYRGGLAQGRHQAGHVFLRTKAEACSIS